MFDNRETRQTDSSSGKILKDVSLTLLIAKQWPFERELLGYYLNLSSLTLREETSTVVWISFGTHAKVA